MLRVDVRAQVLPAARRTSLTATAAAGRLSRGYSDYAENATCAGPAKSIAATYFRLLRGCGYGRHGCPTEHSPLGSARLGPSQDN